jgi:hypothetical protein
LNVKHRISHPTSHLQRPEVSNTTYYLLLTTYYVVLVSGRRLTAPDLPARATKHNKFDLLVTTAQTNFSILCCARFRRTVWA